MAGPSLLAQAQAQLQHDLDALPADRTGGVWLAATTEGVRVVIATKVDRDDWTLEVSGTVGVSKGHGLEGGAQLMATWGGHA